jgi:hypothetical protein
MFGFPGRTSVQELADRVNLLETHIKVNDSESWVGSPLWVHRRCQEPMFSISNKITYDELMIYDTPVGVSALPKSFWLNVESEDVRGHWIEAVRKGSRNGYSRNIKSRLSAERNLPDFTFCRSGSLFKNNRQKVRN